MLSIPPIYTPGFENYNDPLTAKFLLQLTVPLQSARSPTYGNVDESRLPPWMWINQWMRKREASAMAIVCVSFFNDRGEVHIEAKVTPRMMPGVVALGEGAWYSPDANRIDRAGSINVLTTQRRRWRKATCPTKPCSGCEKV